MVFWQGTVFLCKEEGARIKDDRLTAMSKDYPRELRNLQPAEREAIMSVCKACDRAGPLQNPLDICSACFINVVTNMLVCGSTDNSVSPTIQDHEEKQIPIETHTADAQAESCPPEDGKGNIEAKPREEGLDVLLATEVRGHPSHVPGTVNTNEAGEPCDEGGETPKRKSRKKKSTKSKPRRRSTKENVTQVHESDLEAQDGMEATEDQALSDKTPQTPKLRTPKRRSKDEVCATCRCLTPKRKGKQSSAVSNFCDKCDEERLQRRKSLRSSSKRDDETLSRTASLVNFVNVKLHFTFNNDKGYRRWRMRPSDSLSSLLKSIAEKLNFEEAVDLKYIDDEEDTITLKSDEDVKEMFNIVERGRIDPLILTSTAKQD